MYKLLTVKLPSWATPPVMKTFDMFWVAMSPHPMLDLAKYPFVANSPKLLDLSKNM